MKVRLVNSIQKLCSGACVGSFEQGNSRVDTISRQFSRIRLLCLTPVVFGIFWIFEFIWQWRCRRIDAILVFVGPSRASKEVDRADSRPSIGNNSRAANCAVVYAQCLSDTQVLETPSANLLPVLTLVLIIYFTSFLLWMNVENLGQLSTLQGS